MKYHITRPSSGEHQRLLASDLPVGKRGAPHEQREEQRRAVQLVGVEQRDHQHRAEVVDDRERQQKHLQPSGTRSPSSASTPSANAMSVAIGTPQPWMVGSPGLNAT